MKGMENICKEIIWKIKIPMKMIIFLWLINRKAILKWENLRKRGWKGPSRCILCRLEEETIEHIFIKDRTHIH